MRPLTLFAGAAFAVAAAAAAGASEKQPAKHVNETVQEAAAPAIEAAAQSKPIAPAPILRKQKVAPKIAPVIKKDATILTPPLQFTGTGKPLSGGAALATTAIRTPVITFTGTGAPLVTRVEVGETAIRTPALRFTGTGSLEP